MTTELTTPTLYAIPLQPQAQTFQVTLASIQYQFTLQYCNAPNGGWILSIADNQGNPIVSSIPLVTGVDLLGQYQYLGLGGSLYVQTPANLGAVPTYDELGVSSFLYFYVS